MKVFVITHTHWDREWFLTFDTFKSRLKNLAELLIEIFNKNKDFKHFHFDGQTVVVEDLYELNKNLERKIIELINDGKITVGPWYVLPDEFLIMGESLIRNFLYSKFISKKLGIKILSDIGYLPDMFGHNAYTPSILKGLELKSAILWRGVGDSAKNIEFIWQAPNGDSILTLHLRNSYSNGARFDRNINKLKDVFRREIEDLKKHTISGAVLIMNGTDHEFPDPEIGKRISQWASEWNVDMSHSSIEEYVNFVLSSLNDKFEKLDTIRGELRSSKREHILRDVTSTRINIKQLNFYAQSLMIYYLEPLTAILRKKASFEDYYKTWKNILLSHPHDSICGCSIDQVHEEVEVRLRKSIDEARNFILDLMKEKSKDFIDSKKIQENKTLLIFNPLEFPSNRILNFIFNVDENVELDFIDSTGNSLEKLEKEINIDQYDSFNNLLSSFNLIEKFRSNDRKLRKKFIEITLNVDLPSMGFKTVKIIEKTKKSADKKFVVDDKNMYSNDMYTFELNNDGSFIVKCEGKNFEFKGFSDIGDRGDEYNHDPIFPIFETHENIKDLKIYESDFMREYNFYLPFKIPIALEKNEKNRSKELIEIPLNVIYKLHKRKRRIDVEVILDNLAKDHKLMAKILIPKFIDTINNDGYFGLVSHPTQVKNNNEYIEDNIPRYAMNTFVVANYDDMKIIIATRGLHEYEVNRKNNSTELYLTFLRSVGWLSKGDLKTRKGYAGPMLSTPNAQMLKRLHFEFSLIFGNFVDEIEIYKSVKDYLYPPLAVLYNGKAKKDEESYFQLENSVLSSFKSSDDGKRILRIFNPSSQDKVINIFAKDMRLLKETNFREEKITNIESVESCKYSTKLNRGEIKTFILD